MRRVLPVLLVLVGIATLGWLAMDLGWFGGAGDGERDSDTVVAPAEAKASGRLAADANAGADPKTYEGDPVGRVELGLGDAAVHGVVVGPAGPIRFARVVVVLPPPAVGAVRTGKDGRFAVHGLPAAAHEVRVGADGHRSRTVVTPALAAGEDADLGEIALTPRPPASDGIEVKVLGPDGRPVANARVTATSLTYGLYLAMPAEMHGITGIEAKETVTDERGVARLAPLAPEKYDVVVRAEGFALEVVENVVVALGRVEHVTMRLTPGLSIAGTVVGPDGTGLSEGYVFALHQPTFRTYESVRTGAGGVFLLTGLDPGTYWIFGGHDDYGVGSDRKAKAGDRGVRIALSGAGTLAGRVVRADGKPATKFVLRPYPVGQPFGYVYSALFRVEDAEGRFEQKVPPGNYQVDAKEEGGAFVAGPTATVEAGGRTEVEVRLPAPGTVRGVVVEDRTGDHVAGAEVYVNKGGFPPTPVRELYVRTDADGAFRLDGLPPEEVKLHVRHPAFALRVMDAVPAPPESSRDVTVRLSKGSRVEGRVLRTDDAPVAGEQVNLFKGFDFLNAKTTFTDAAGRFAFFALAPDTYQVSLGKFENMAAGQQKNVAVPADGTATVEFRTEGTDAGTVSVAGRVTMGGEPVAGANVFVTDSRGLEATVSLTTDASGRYEAKGLEPGRVRVSVSTEDGLSTTRNTRVATPGQSATLDLAFGAGRVRGHVVEDDGRTPVSGAEVSVELTEGAEGWDAVRAWVTTDTQGEFQAAGLDPGPYRVRASALGRASRMLEPFRLSEGETKEVGTIRLPLGAALRGRVVDSEGRPVENASVSLKDASGKDVFLFSLFSSGSDGRYEVQGLALGRYTLRIEAKGYAPFEKAVDVGSGGASVDAVVERGGAVTLVVEDESGKPVPAARIEIRDGQGRPVTRTLSIVNLFDADVTRTNAEGRTTIPDLAPGTYDFGATKDGLVLAGEAARVTVASGGTASARVVLKAR